jgi:flagellar FliL protein
MFCIHCGANNQQEGKFCFQCGKALVEADTPVGESNEQARPQAGPEDSQQNVTNAAVIPNEKPDSASGSQNFFITVWQGDWGLAKTYWILVVLGNLLWFALNPSMKAGVPLWALIGVITFYHIWAFVGIWRSAGKYKGPIAWRYLSRGATLIGAMYLIAGLAIIKQGVYSQARLTAQEVETSSSESPGRNQPIFVPMETLTVNLQADGGGEHYLQVGIALKVDAPDAVDLIKLHMPGIRDGVLRLLSSKSAKQIASLDGKQKLSAEIQEQVNKPLNAKVTGKGVTGVFFTSFVIQ